MLQTLKAQARPQALKFNREEATASSDTHSRFKSAPKNVMRAPWAKAHPVHSS